MKTSCGFLILLCCQGATSFQSKSQHVAFTKKISAVSFSSSDLRSTLVPFESEQSYYGQEEFGPEGGFYEPESQFFEPPQPLYFDQQQRFYDSESRGFPIQTYDRGSNLAYGGDGIVLDGSFTPIQGGSIETWPVHNAERVKMTLATNGRPMNADVELWNGPNDNPVKMKVFLESGDARPFSTVIETPRGPNTVSAKNTASLEFPIYARMDTYGIERPLEMMAPPQTIQGGALKHYPFESSVQSVQVVLSTDGAPLNAKIEILQGANNAKQQIELYTDDGLDRPFFAVFETPGAGNTIKIKNTSPMTYPLMASVDPHMIYDMYGSSSFGGSYPMRSGYNMGPAPMRSSNMIGPAGMRW